MDDIKIIENITSKKIQDKNRGEGQRDSYPPPSDFKEENEKVSSKIKREKSLDFSLTFKFFVFVSFLIILN